MEQQVRCDRTTREYDMDPRRVLVSELNRQDREHAEKPDWIGGLRVDQRIGASDVYLMFDSRQRNRSDSKIEEGKFVFDINTYGQTGRQLIGTSMELHDVSEMEITSFPIPDLPLIPYTVNPDINPSLPVLVPNPADPAADVKEQLVQNRLIVQILETSVESVSDPNGVSHNFEMDLVQVNTQVYASPVQPVYVFTRPQQSFERLTFVFRSPYRKLIFLPDVLEGSRFSVEPAPSTLLRIYAPDHGLVEDDRIVLGKLTPGTLPPKVYNYLNGAPLIVGANGTADYIRLNPDIDMAEFIANAVTTNLVWKTRDEATAAGFTDFVPGRQIILPTTATLPDVTDVTSVVPGRSFSFGDTYIRYIYQIVRFSALPDPADNTDYQMTDPKNDIKADGIRLTRSTTFLANPGGFDVDVPSRALRVQMRFRRIVRAVTQLAGI